MFKETFGIKEEDEIKGLGEVIDEELENEEAFKCLEPNYSGCCPVCAAQCLVVFLHKQGYVYILCAACMYRMHLIPDAFVQSGLVNLQTELNLKMDEVFGAVEKIHKNQREDEVSIHGNIVEDEINEALLEVTKAMQISIHSRMDYSFEHYRKEITRRWI